MTFLIYKFDIFSKLLYTMHRKKFLWGLSYKIKKNRGSCSFLYFFSFFMYCIISRSIRSFNNLIKSFIIKSPPLWRCFYSTINIYFMQHIYIIINKYFYIFFNMLLFISNYFFYIEYFPFCFSISYFIQFIYFIHI